MKTRQAIAISTCAAIVGLSAASAWASSHREAPAIAEDPCADNTDVYTFISPENPDNLVVVANYIPLLVPSSGPNFFKFCNNVAYDIRFDNNGDARTDIIYRFLFKSKVQNGDTFLYNVGPVASLDDPDLNVRQVLDVVRLDRRGRLEDVIAADLPVAPWHVGDRSFPDNSYENVALTAVKETADGIKIFAGPRDEPFFVDLHVFDLLGVGGAPTTDGFNVMSIVFEVPIDDLLDEDAERPISTEAKGAILGVHATASRKRKRILRRNRVARERGRYVQVSRLAVPLVNEVLVPLKDKDKFNRSQPQYDLNNIGSYVLFPELPGLLTAVLGAGCPQTPEAGRTDIVGILSPNGTKPADLLRINIAEGQTFEDSVFPNGRWLADDVTDVLLNVLCANPNLQLGDGVNGNDRPFSLTFPYLATPHSGNPIQAMPY
ncbi:MAG: DUF4331 domain-containing protein [Proteobacteria bacterium]|nr:DUF4331 domain-containing protein [Pseudomonadota bacterium]